MVSRRQLTALLALELLLAASAAQAQFRPATVTWDNLPPAPAACLGPPIFVVEESASLSGPFSVVPGGVILDGSLSVSNLPVYSNPAFFFVVMRCPGVGIISISNIERLTLTQ